MRLRRLTRMVVSIALVGTFASGAQAAPIIGFGDPLTAPALAGGTQEGFDAVATGQYNSLTLGNVTYIGVDAPFDIDSDFNGFYNTTGGQSLLNDFDLVPIQYRFNFSSPVNAFAFNWGAADTTWTLQAFDAGNNLLETLVINPTFSSNAGEFFGLAVNGISYATLVGNAGGDYVFIDRFTTSQQQVAAPEPASLALLGLGLAGAIRARRRVRKA